MLNHIEMTIPCWEHTNKRQFHLRTKGMMELLNDKASLLPLTHHGINLHICLKGSVYPLYTVNVGGLCPSKKDTLHTMI